MNIHLGKGTGRSEGNGAPLTIESLPHKTQVPTMRAGALAHPAFTTAQRPSAADVGAGGTVYDSTLKRLVTSDGTGWFDQTGTAA